MIQYSEYECHGHFYNITTNGSIIAYGRSQLDIIDFKKMNRNNLIISKPDALVIMMNPGTSEPLNRNYHIQQISLNAFMIEEKKDLVLTVSDETQKRLMKIMHYKKWKHVRVINLSDIRQYKSEKLASEIKKYKSFSSGNEHSIFSRVRRSELLRTLNEANDKPLVLAWGTQTCLKPFINECRTILNDKRLYGIMAAKEGYYHHPLTRKIRWVESILKLLDE